MKEYNAQMTLWEHSIMLIRNVTAGFLSCGESNEEELMGRGFLFVKGAGCSVVLNKTIHVVEQCSLFHAASTASINITSSSVSTTYILVRYDIEMPSDNQKNMMRLLDHDNPFESCYCMVPSNPFYFEEQFSKAAECWREATPLNRLRVKAIMGNVIYELHRQATDNGQTYSRKDSFELVRAYLEERYMEPITIQMIADTLQTSYSTINRVFHQRLGQSAQQYLMDLRFDAARRALNNSNMTINDVALTTGFQDKAYFAKAFKARFAITPGEYRRLKRPDVTVSRLLKGRHIVISNFQRITEYTTVPERIVCLSIPEAEICAALGLSDKIVAIAVACGSLEGCAPAYKEVLKNIPVISSENGIRGIIKMQDVIAFNPDFVYGTANRFTHPLGIAPIDEFLARNINVYVSSATYTIKATIDDIYNDILNISRIFGVEERGVELVNQMQTLAEKTISDVGIPEKRTKVFVMDAEIRGMAYTTGMSLETELIHLAGGENVFGHISNTFELVEWQSVKRAAPECIIVHEFWPERKTKEKIDRILSMDELKDVPAIRNKRIKVVRLTNVFPSLHAAETIAELAEWFKSS